MNLFRHELKKIWNPRILLLIAALAVLVWFTMLRGLLNSYESLGTHGGYGSHQRELFERYGDTLEPEEWAAYDVPGRKAALESEMNALIADDPRFAEYGVRDYREYRAFAERSTEGMNDRQTAQFLEAAGDMQDRLSLRRDGQTLDEFYASPQIQMQTLEALESAYAEYGPTLQTIIARDERPVVVEAAEQILKRHNDSLIRVDLCETVSMYAATIGVFAIAATLLLTGVPLARDRARNIYLIQYSSQTGRRILFVQGAAMLASGCAVSLLSIVIGSLPLIAAGMGDYAHASIQSFTYFEMGLYDMTFGRYALVLAGMIVLMCAASAGLAFILAKFSANLITMLIKLVPTGIALSGLAVLAISRAFSFHNILFSGVLRGRVAMPEPILCAALAAIGLAGALWVALREKKADVS
ncbi:hypothetical protein CDO73_08570 [Saccharibacillus sp. O23]|uniref:hypothetical protein n=1 Tax=Saccharibacillus sp. O23 TaxID=2009338 RepID=UPI000B4DF9FE|nr:hypothetical protein [Saccharibacillus sp. O23]OWR31180.1 hypothetical protein CDO73_08570 [Saccharibacillus sp. O23]